jgi:pimeloyl-ACP methyl ester carboxylesterase
MTANRIRARIGRRLRLGFVGGSSSAMIGPVHRLAARLDDFYEPVAAALSSDPQRGLAEGTALGIPRVYPDFAALIAGEAGRSDKPDAIAIATPNDLHREQACAALEAGYPVICDKPLANNLADARAIDERSLPRRLAVPTLLVHGTADDVIPQLVSERFFQALAHPQKELWLVPGGDHRLADVADAIWPRLDALLAR